MLYRFLDLFGTQRGAELWDNAIPVSSDDPILAPSSLTVSLWAFCDCVSKPQFKDQLGDGLAEYVRMFLQEKVRPF